MKGLVGDIMGFEGERERREFLVGEKVRRQKVIIEGSVECV